MPSLDNVESFRSDSTSREVVSGAECVDKELSPPEASASAGVGGKVLESKRVGRMKMLKLGI